MGIDQQTQPAQPAQPDDLDRELAEAQQQADAAALSPAEEERARKLAQLEELRAARRAAEARRRKLAGDALEREARTEAAGRYLVRCVDVAALLPDVPASSLPGDGLVVVRSHPPDAKRTWDREVEARARDLSEINADLVCASVVRPRLSGDAGVRFRAFVASELGCGIGNQLLVPVLELGGARMAETKRGR